MSTTVIILAAGKGTRMRSQLPKVLQPLAGRPLLEHVIQTAKKYTQKILLRFMGMVVTTSNKLLHKKILWVKQAEQLGTGHAVQ